MEKINEKIIEIPDDVADKFEQQNYKMSVEQNQIVLKVTLISLMHKIFRYTICLFPVY